MKYLLQLLILMFAALLCNSCQQQKAVYTPNPKETSTTPTERREVKPLFNVENLVGKNQTQVDKILGKPTDSWDMSSDPTRQMREYSIGESLSMIFYKNRIETLTLFFSSPQSDTEAVFSLIGLRLNGRKPDMDTGKSKIFNNFLIKNTPAKIAVADEWIKLEFIDK